MSKKDIWEAASSMHEEGNGKDRRVLVLTFKDAVKSMEFSCSGCFSEHSTLSAFTPKIET